MDSATRQNPQREYADSVSTHWNFKSVEPIHRVLHLVRPSDEIPSFGVVIFDTESAKGDDVIGNAYRRARDRNRSTIRI
jgi:hypothetical protein